MGEKDKEKTGEKDKEKEKEKEKDSNIDRVSGDKEKEDNKIPPELEKPLLFFIIAVILYGIVYSLSSVDHEISLEKLAEQYISKGLVSHIVVTRGYNKADIYLRGEKKPRLSVRTGDNLEIFEEKIELFEARFQVPEIPIFFHNPPLTKFLFYYYYFSFL